MLLYDTILSLSGSKVGFAVCPRELCKAPIILFISSIAETVRVNHVRTPSSYSHYIRKRRSNQECSLAAQLSSRMVRRKWRILWHDSSHSGVFAHWQSGHIAGILQQIRRSKVCHQTWYLFMMNHEMPDYSSMFPLKIGSIWETNFSLFLK